MLVTKKRPTPMSKKPIKISRLLGFTLIELLVGLVLSLFIFGIALTYFASSTRTFNANISDAYIQENSRFLFMMLNTGLRRGGLNTLQNLEAGDTPMFFTLPLCPDSQGRGSSTACTASAIGQNNSDRIAVAYVNHVGVESCNGTTITPAMLANGEQVVDVYTVTNDGVLNSLSCATYLYVPDSSSLNIQGNLQPLVGGVDMLKFQFIVDSNNDSIVDRNYSLADVTAQGLWGQVRSVKVAALISSGQDVDAVNSVEDASVGSQTRSYDLFGEKSPDFNDRASRKIYSTTISIPNVMDL